MALAICVSAGTPMAKCELRGPGTSQRRQIPVSTIAEDYCPRSGLTKRVTSHTVRRSFATRLLADGFDIRTVQELLGHKNARTTMIYAHVLNRGGLGVRSPDDGLARRSDER
jgi:integrase